MSATIGNLEGEGFARPTLVQGVGNRLFFDGLPVRWADAEVQQWPSVSDIAGFGPRVGPSPTDAQGARFGHRYAFGMNKHLLDLVRPDTDVTIAVPRPTLDQIPDQRPATLLSARGFVTNFPEARPQRWDVVGGGDSEQ